jgi:tetratricopeptide (TPR) repeat protein
MAIRHSLVQCLTELGQFDDGSRYGQEAMRIAEAAGHAFSLYQAWRSLASLYLCQGALNHAIALLERALALCQEADLPYGVPATVSRLGWADAQAGHPVEALADLEQMGQLAASHRTAGGYAMWLVLLSEGYVAVGRLSAAIPLAHEALATARDRKERGAKGYAPRLLGTLTAQGTAPDVVAAARYYQHAILLAQELGMRPLLAHCHRGLGMLYAQAGRPEQARAELSAAVDLYHTMKMTFWLPETGAALAQMKEG